MKPKSKNSFAALDHRTHSDDYISRLPDDILCFIISLLPFQSALSTNLLSTRWQGLWKAATRTVVATTGNYEQLKVEAAIQNLIADIDALDSNRSLKFYCGLDRTGRDRTVLATFDFSEPNTEEPSPPWVFWRVKAHPEPPGSVASASFVRTLHLNSVTCLTPELVSSIAKHLHYLESLHISKCNGLTYMYLTFGQSLLLLRISDCVQLKCLFVTAENLQSFLFQGLLPSVCLTTTCLKDVMLHSRKGMPQNTKPCSFPLTQLESLTLCTLTFQAMRCPQLHYQLFHRLKSLWWIEYSASDSREALMSFLGLCPALEQLFITIDPSGATTTKCISWKGSGRTTKLKHLKVVVLEGFANLEEELLVAEQLRGIVTKEPLELILTKSQDNRFMSILKVPLIRGGKKSRRVYVRARQREWSYQYVEGVELRPKHAHMCS